MGVVVEGPPLGVAEVGEEVHHEEGVEAVEEPHRRGEGVAGVSCSGALPLSVGFPGGVFSPRRWACGGGGADPEAPAAG